jgi:membrane protein implicated in regulation of membrane protease activity
VSGRGKGGARGRARAGSARGAGRRGPRGRLVVALALVAFVSVGAAVIWRRVTGIANARELRLLATQRAQLVAERAALESAVRAAAGRGRIGGVAEQRLGMRVPADTQVVILTRPPVADTAGAGPPPR